MRILQSQNFKSHLTSNLFAAGYDAPMSYHDDKTAWEMVILMANRFRRILRDRVVASPYYGIIVDETTDNSTTPQMIIYIKFLLRDENGNLTVVVEYLDLISPHSGKAT